jgi:hypothetical protein
MLKKETLRRRDDGLFPEPEGEIIEVLDETRTTKLRVLTRVGQNREEGEAADDGPDIRFDDDGDPYCTGSENTCSRTVSEPGETCWQHGDD